LIKERVTNGKNSTTSDAFIALATRELERLDTKIIAVYPFQRLGDTKIRCIQT